MSSKKRTEFDDARAALQNAISISMEEDLVHLNFGAEVGQEPRRNPEQPSKAEGPKKAAKPMDASGSGETAGDSSEKRPSKPLTDAKPADSKKASKTVKVARPAKGAKSKAASKKPRSQKSASKEGKKPSKGADVQALPYRESSPIWQNIALGGLFVALILCTLMGTGFLLISYILGIALCIIGFFQKSIKIDWWILGPLIVFFLFGFTSTYAARGDIVSGYVSMQLIYMVIYVLLGCLNTDRSLFLKKLCVMWVAFVAVLGLFQFAVDAFSGSASRLNVIIDNPNGLGIFMVLGWFALLNCRMQDKQAGYDPDLRMTIFAGSGSYHKRETGKRPEEVKITDRINGGITFILPALEPLMLVALMLTLSMGSIVALIIGLVVFVLYEKSTVKGRTWKDAIDSFCFYLAKMVVCFLTGIFMYLSADQAGLPFVTELLLIYTIAMAVLWKKFEQFLREHKATSIALSVVSVIAAIGAAILRPSSLATFAERFEMMGNGVNYLGVNPILGLGPNQWRLYNLYDSDTYYNVWHIHDLFIQMGVELGLIAMICLVVIAVRCFMKRAKQAQQGENAAMLFHMAIDAGFFILGIVSLFIMTAGNPERKGTVLRSLGLKIFFLIVGLLYVDLLMAAPQFLLSNM